MNPPREDRISVRLEPDDRECLDWLIAYVRSTTAPGIRVEVSDAIRWVLHAARAALAETTPQD